MVLRSQTITNSERRYINSKVLDLIEDFESYASMYDEDAVYYMGTLFESENSPVLCDMIGSPQYQTRIPVSEYMSLLTSQSLNTSIVIRDVKKGTMSYSDGKWRIPVTFNKDLAYIDKGGYLFSVSSYYLKEFTMTMNVIYDTDRDVCFIESIDGKLSSEKTFPKGRFLIIDDTDNYDTDWQKHFSTLTVGGEPLEFNESGYAILPNAEPQVKDLDVIVVTDTVGTGFNYDVVKYDFIPLNTRLKLRYGMAPFGAYDVTFKESDSEIGNKSQAMEFGVDLGFTFSVGSASKMGFYFGAALSMSTLELALAQPLSYDYKYTAVNGNLPSDNTPLYKTETRKYTVSDASEAVRYTDLMVPVYFEIEHRLGKHAMFSWNLGAKAYYALGAENTVPYTVKVNDSVLNNQNKFVEPNKYSKDLDFDLSLMANIGLDINLLKRRLYLSLKGGYEYGILQTYSSDTNPYFSSSSQSNVYPVVFDGSKDVAVHSLISGVSFRRSAIWLSAGLKFKL